MKDNGFFAEVANRIKRFRLLKRTRQAEIAEFVELSPRHYQKIEAGQIDIKTSTCHSLAKGIGVPPCYLFNTKGSPGHSHQFGCTVEILEMLQFGMVLTDVSGNLLWSNKLFQKRLGQETVSQIQFNESHLWDYLNDDKDTPELKMYIDHLVAKKVPIAPFFTKIKSAQEGALPVKIECQLVLQETGAVKYILSIINYHPSW